MKKYQYGKAVTVDTKVCYHCKQEKDADEFGRNGAHSDGLKPYCKPCEAELKRPHQARWSRNRHLDKKEEAHRASVRRATKRLIAAGELTEPKECVMCGTTEGIEIHHVDYTPENIMGLCQKHHKQAHAILRQQKR